MKFYFSKNKSLLCNKLNHPRGLFSLRGGNFLHVDENFLDNFYIVTCSRHHLPITDVLRPFGSFDELDIMYENDFPEDLAKIKDLYLDIGAQIVGSSQYGLYFRLIEREKVDQYKFYENDEVEFSIRRSFIFDSLLLLDYIEKETENIPLVHYCNSSNYGYSSHLDKVNRKFLDIPGCIRLGKDGFNEFEEFIKYNFTPEHELVVKIPIPLVPETGFKGKINKCFI